MPTPPPSSAAQNGLAGDLNATMTAAQVGQELGTHKFNVLYQGNAIVTPGGGLSFTWTNYGDNNDLDQPFVMPAGSTAIGRVVLPMLPSGDAADVHVSLYTDSGGSPNLAAGALASTLIPAQQINALSAPFGLADAGPLAKPSNNVMYAATGISAQQPWAVQAGGSNGTSTHPQTCVAGNNVIFVGGYDATVTSHPSTGVVVTAAIDSSTVSPPVAQPSLPQPAQDGALAVTSDTVIFTGGNYTPTVGSTGGLTNTWTASWDPNTGVIGAWSSQTPIPAAIALHASVTYNDSFVYIAGGEDISVNVQKKVWKASISNGQVGSWVAQGNLPIAVISPAMAVIGNWMVVAGGSDQSGTVRTEVYYAGINSDGSLGPWKQAPDMPLPFASFNNGQTFSTPNALVTWGGQSNPMFFSDAVQVLTVDADGPADKWTLSHIPTGGENNVVAPFDIEDGTFSVLDINPNPGGIAYYTTSELVPVPYLSVPLPVSGLTSGTTYHVVIRQSRSSNSGSVAFGLLNGTPLPLAARTHARYTTGSWASVGAGMSVPMSVFDASTSASPIVLHTWEAIPSSDYPDFPSPATQTWVTGYQGDPSVIIGHCASVAVLNAALNVNPTFTTGVSPWTGHNGATITQSNAQTHGGLPFSGLLTPNGTTANPFVESEMFSVTPAAYYLVAGWAYSSNGATFSMSANWYDASSAYISTSSHSVSVPAATWTFVSNVFTSPAGAAFAAIVPTHVGTPTSANTTYLSNVAMLVYPAEAPQIASVQQVLYDPTTLLASATVLL
ncbi:Kelch repeat-containing protein [Actinacidiphila rubida]|uniref:Uncharacterized protein n=1 Tax=Actinacidiphila rubida TaxID=310780 RepID=A0A1H8L8Z3_9ACTN|nr:hypothetical protein [Actinacidiphila rubida]SEO01539.1 hypothetical protein SAMN05216267_1015103 [Actinacidiphila rubida]